MHIKENLKYYHVHQKELSHRKTSQSHMHAQYVHTSSIQLNSKSNFKGLKEIYIKMAAVGFFIAGLEPGDGAVVHLQTPQFSMLESIF